MIKELLIDFIAILGAASLCYGCYLIYIPAAFIVFGILCLLVVYGAVKRIAP